ncbi:MAG: GNAT family N-acetyltransferase, partial [Planctomycetes bacterium]|nr:GNAT family N-acetyltransferase [Planctomycetota bacterium]
MKPVPLGDFRSLGMRIRRLEDKTIPPYRLVAADRETWDRCWAQVQGSPLYQSWEYGAARHHSQLFRPERFVIRRGAEGAPVGLLQVLVYAVPLLGGVARISRGPVFLNGSLSPEQAPEDLEAVFGAIRAAARRQRWRLIRIAPELPPSDETTAHLGRLGFKRRLEGMAVASAVIDLARPPEEIRAGFHSKWRNLLNKSEKIGLTLESPPLPAALAFLAREYESMQRDKGFQGVPTGLLRQMAAQEGPRWACRLLFARHAQDRCGMVMVVGHGDTCTYLVGWTSEPGRALQANSFLLWQAMLLFRTLGYRFFDVGGLGGRTTEGVEHCKKRLQGR